MPLYEAEKLDSGQIPDILVKFEKAEKNFMENIGDHLQLMNNAYVFSGYFKTNLKKRIEDLLTFNLENQFKFDQSRKILR